MNALATPLKLNLGSRDRVLLGYKNLDLEPHPGVDFVGDAGDLSRFEDNSIAATRASHILEHFPHTKTDAVLGEWCRVLMPGGMLEVAVPDFERVLELYSKCGLVDWVENFVCGDQEYAGAFHYAIFDERRLSEKLLKAGFSEASRVVRFREKVPKECSELISTEDMKPVSLNFLAIK